MGACTCEACEPYWNTYVGLIHALASELCEPYRNDILSSEAFEECGECEECEECKEFEVFETFENFEACEACKAYGPCKACGACGPYENLNIGMISALASGFSLPYWDADSGFRDALICEP